MLKSLVTEWLGCSGSESAGDTSSVDIDWDSLYWGVWPRSRLLLIICKMGRGWVDRIVQYKMILKQDLIPIQDDPENVKRRGVPRPNANTYAERRRAHRGTDSRVPQGQRGHRVPRPEAGRIVRLGAASLGGTGVCHAGQEAARSGAGLHRQDDRAEPTPGHTVDPQVPRRRSCGSGALPAAALPGEVQQSRRGAAGRSGPSARLAERAGDGAHHAARTPTVRQGRICAAGGNLRGASVQSARQRRVPQTGGEMGADASHSQQHRGAAQTRSAGTARFSTHRHRTPRRLERSQRGVSHQCGGRGDAVAGSGLRGPDQRATSPARVGGDLASVSLPDSGITSRQRLGIHQPRGGQVAQASTDRVHQKPGQSEPGQRAGGRQERGDHSQAHGLRTHRRRTCRSGTQVPHGVPKPILELSSSVWIRDGEPGRARQTAAAIQTGRLCDAIREVEELAGGGEILEGGDELCATGRGGAENERHRMGAEAGGGQRGIAAAPQERIAGRSGNELRWRGEDYGNAGSMESVEKQKQLFPSFHGPLEISPKARDSHIPTAWHAPDGKVGNQNQVSHFPTRGMRRRVRFVCFQNKKPRKEIGRSAASSTSFFRITLDWKRNSVSGSSFDWKMLRATVAARADSPCDMLTRIEEGSHATSDGCRRRAKPGNYF